MSDQTPQEIQAEIDALEAAEFAAESTPEVAAPVIAPQPSTVKRILPTGQFYQGQQGTDSK
jgi:hypothetical protein